MRKYLLPVAAAAFAVAATSSYAAQTSDNFQARITIVTSCIVTAADLALMKPTALLVNAARAELIAPGALEQALRNGRPGRAAVDVYENEPVLGGDHPLLKMDNALCTPHSAWIEKDMFELYFGEAFDNVIKFARGETVNLVNPAVLEQR